MALRYLSVGNLRRDDVIRWSSSTYPDQRRLKLLGRVRLVEVREDEAGFAALRDDSRRAKSSRSISIELTNPFNVHGFVGSHQFVATSRAWLNDCLRNEHKVSTMNDGPMRDGSSAHATRSADRDESGMQTVMMGTVSRSLVYDGMQSNSRRRDPHHRAFAYDALPCIPSSKKWSDRGSSIPNQCYGRNSKGITKRATEMGKVREAVIKRSIGHGARATLCQGAPARF